MFDCFVAIRFIKELYIIGWTVTWFWKWALRGDIFLLHCEVLVLRWILGTVVHCVVLELFQGVPCRCHITDSSHTSTCCLGTQLLWHSVPWHEGGWHAEPTSVGSTCQLHHVSLGTSGDPCPLLGCPGSSGSNDARCCSNFYMIMHLWGSSSFI
jgi:hypothetical protein